MKTSQLPYTALAKAIGLSSDVYVKREDEHPYGSHKGRSIPYMITHYATRTDNPIRSFVISSSGNAAIAAAYAVREYNKKNNEQITLDIYIGKHIHPEKKAHLEQLIHQETTIQIHQVDEPKKTAFQHGQDINRVNLRQSTDDTALVGYKELAEELLDIPNLRAVFIPTSSGTTAQALGNIFLAHQKPIQIHIVQTTECAPIASQYDTTEQKEQSLADAIVDNIAHRKQAVTATIQKTHGSGFIITNQEIIAAQTLVKDTTGITLSPTSALSIAGLCKARKHGWSWAGAVACLITGK